MLVWNDLKLTWPILFSVLYFTATFTLKMTRSCWYSFYIMQHLLTPFYLSKTCLVISLPMIFPRLSCMQFWLGWRRTFQHFIFQYFLYSHSCVQDFSRYANPNPSNFLHLRSLDLVMLFFLMHLLLLLFCTWKWAPYFGGYIPFFVLWIMPQNLVANHIPLLFILANMPHYLVATVFYLLCSTFCTIYASYD